jgi:hypothetical protein
LTLKKTLKTMLLTLLLAILTLVAVLGLFGRLPPSADANPNAVLARAVAPYLRDGYAFRLADAYPDAWDTVQLVGEGEPLDPWTWRALRAYDAGLAQQLEGAQLLVFWREGAVARMVRFTAAQSGMPWFVLPASEPGSAILSRDAAVFTATRTQAGRTAYYVCAPLGKAVPV